MIGCRVGPYQIHDKIGEGGMGAVYLARDERLGRDVAVKVVSPGPGATETARLRLLREAQLASALNHQNICTIYGVEESSGQTLIVMEHVSGRRLRDAIPAGGLPAATAMRYGSEIADALAHAHGRNILHRDLKTANVMITAEDRVKVLDFGLAKRLEGSDAQALTRSELSLTEPGSVVGTLYAMAPELLRGEEASPRSDIWALGIVLYEMVAGRPPFDGKTNFELSAAVLREEPVPLPAAVPAGLQSVIARCLAKEPGRRYQSAGEVRAALDAAHSSTSVPVLPQRNVKKMVWYACAAAAAVAVGVSAWFLATSSRRHPGLVKYEQLTNFSDSVTSPALSPDGRMLAFIHGESTFDGLGDIWVKLLPDGEPVQLTKDGARIMKPVFSPDGSKIAYTHLDLGNWDSWTVRSMGGAAERWLPNAAGLTWIGNQQVMFSEITTGLYMKLVTSDENRGGERDVYLPHSGEISMAHTSALSPDRKWVLVTEMDNHGWLPCRVVPFAGGSEARIVGPAPSKCTSAAWSPDGKWMYLGADAGNGFHLWRQDFSGGKPEQLTSGTTEEEGIAVDPDGKSLITAIGSEQSSIFLEEHGAMRQITSQGYAYSPSLSTDGKKVYYVLRTALGRAFVAGDFRAMNLDGGQEERLLPGFSVTRYDLSPDGQRVVFAALDADGKSSVWLASLTRSFAPRQLSQKEAYRPYFAPGGVLYYLSLENGKDYVYRMKEDGTGQEKVIADPVIYLLAVSPDGKQLVAWVDRNEGDSPSAVVVYPAAGGKPAILCARCAATGPAYPGAGIVSWSPDQKFLYLRMDLPGMQSRATMVIPLALGRALPELPAGGFASVQELKAIPGVREIPQKDVFPGQDPSTYVISRTTTQRNLYRVRLP
jgi:serine/threonine protein kinase/Tol biopolymer transport system component